MKLARAEQVWQMLSEQVSAKAGLPAAPEDALGRILAHDALAALDYPPFDRAVMDGFAVRTEDFTPAGTKPVRLRLVGLRRAGAPGLTPLGPGECMQINTGAPLPVGADAIVIVENCRQPDAHTVELHDDPQPNQNIERTASLRRAGDRLVSAGQRLTGPRLAALAAGGVNRVTAHPAPKVSILTTGDEVVAPGAVCGAGQIFDSNGILIRELALRSGAEVHRVAHAPDERAALRAALLEALRGDVLIVCGGMSKGTHDLVPGLLSELGVEWLVESLDLKPGKPTRLGRAPDGSWAIGLPGNPVSCAVCFLLFVRPLLLGLQGVPIRAPRFSTGRLTESLKPNGPRPMFHPASWCFSVDGIELTPRVWRGSGDPFGLVDANALLYRASHAASASVGDPASFLPLELDE